MKIIIRDEIDLQKVITISPVRSFSVSAVSLPLYLRRYDADCHLKYLNAIRRFNGKETPGQSNDQTHLGAHRPRNILFAKLIVFAIYILFIILFINVLRNKLFAFSMTLF
jgi:hypothetical protein